MEAGQTTTDRRVLRSRSALMRAAVSLAVERGTTNITVSDIAEAADVSRQLLYQQFGDRDRALAAAGHFARHRSFYRPMRLRPDEGVERSAHPVQPAARAPDVQRAAGPELLADLTVFVLVRPGLRSRVQTPAARPRGMAFMTSGTQLPPDLPGVRPSAQALVPGSAAPSGGRLCTRRPPRRPAGSAAPPHPRSTPCS